MSSSCSFLLEEILMSEDIPNPNPILITGVSGVVGRVLFNHLNKNYQVFGIDQHTNISSRYQKENSEKLPVEEICPIPSERFLQCDITDREAFFQIVEEKQIRTIIHLAAILEDHPDKEKLYRINVQGTKNVFQAPNVERIIYASSVMTVFGYLTEEPYRSIFMDTFDDQTMLKNLRKLTEDDPPLPDLQTEGNQLYCQTKVLGEQMAEEIVRNSSKSIVTMRLGWFNIYNHPGSTWLRTVWLSHRDLCSFVDRVLQASLKISGIYFVTSNNHRSWMDIQKAQRDFQYIPLDGAQ